MASVPSPPNHQMSVSPGNSEQIHEAARQAVIANPLMDEILRAIEAKGLEPIWGRLIEEFGTVMYSQGRLAQTAKAQRPSRRSIRDR